MRKTNKLMAIVLTCVMAFSVLFSAQNVSAAEFSGTKDEVEQIIGQCANVNPANNNFAYGNEWNILNYVRTNTVTNEQIDTYCHSLAAELEREGGITYTGGPGDYAKVVMTLYALQCDPTTTAGYDWTAPLRNESTVKLNMFGMTYAMIALYAGDTEADCSSYAKAMLDFIDENTGGFDPGWGVDVDGTAMVIQALAPYYNKDDAVKTAVDGALNYLATCYDADLGTIHNFDFVTQDPTPNANTTAQGILALVSLGIDPTRDERFSGNGKDLIKGLQNFYCGNGQYGWTDASVADPGATVQAFQAMIAYDRMLNGQTQYYDFSDLRHVNEPSNPENPKKEEYPVLEGKNQVVDLTKEDTFSIRIDCPIEKFVGVEMDGVLVDPKYYTVKSGSTIVTFTSDYVKTLKAGAHAVTVNFTDGSATVDVTVAKKSEEPKKDTQTNETASQAAVAVQAEKSPKTGESFPIAVCVMMALMAGAVVCTRKRA